MKGNVARSGLCSFVTSVDFGLYSSIVGTRCDCCVRAIRGHSSAEPAASMLTKAKIALQNFIRQLPVSKSRIIASHEQDMRLTMPVQPVDATPSNQLIRQYFLLENRSARLCSIRP